MRSTTPHTFIELENTFWFPPIQLGGFCWILVLVIAVLTARIQILHRKLLDKTHLDLATGGWNMIFLKWAPHSTKRSGSFSE